MKHAVPDPVTLAYHELRSPLGLVITAANALAVESDDEAVHRRSDAIARAAGRMLRTANLVLLMSEPGQESSPQTFTPGDVVSAVVKDFAGLDLPIQQSSTPWANDITATAVEGHFEALVSSLIMNARDHAEPGSPVRVRCSATDDSFEVGIENEVAREDRHRGLSLGTALCRRLADSIGATLAATSEDGLYRVAVTLPAFPSSGG